MEDFIKCRWFYKTITEWVHILITSENIHINLISATLCWVSLVFTQEDEAEDEEKVPSQNLNNSND